MKQQYIGDGVYVTLKNGLLTLTTGHHDEERADNVVHLEPSVWSALKLCMQAWSEQEGENNEN